MAGPKHSFLVLAPMPDIRRILSVNEVHKFPVSCVPSRRDSNLSEGGNYVGSGCGLLEPAEHLDQLRDLVVQAQMRVNTV
jgi:hypothetical protein